MLRSSSGDSSLLFQRYLNAMKQLFFCVFLFPFSLLAQWEDLKFLCEDAVYADYIQTVSFRHSTLEFSLPIIDLGSNGSLRLEFDDREGEFKNYIYRIIHCDKDWVPTITLDETEYLDGFNDQDLPDFGYSSNGYSEYTNYGVTLPNEDVNWMVSGNYLLIIIDSDLEVPVITRRFIVAEKSVNIGIQISNPKDVSKYRTHHELDLIIDYKNLHVSRPIQDISATVMQNGNWNTAKTNVEGTYNRDNKLYFDKYDLITFPALKEFRRFDIRTLNSRREHTHSVERNDFETNVLLDLGESRVWKPNFLNDPDVNGQFLLANDDYGNASVSSEYANVIFSLAMDSPFLQDVYLVGAFCDWNPNDKYLMDYDTERRIYTKTVPFKQGYYEYLFAVLEEDGLLNPSPIEGDLNKTNNDYQVIVYYSRPGTQYDRVLGVTNTDSFNGNEVLRRN